MSPHLNKITRDILLVAVSTLAYYALTHNSIAYPVPKTTPGKWSIERLQHPLVFRLAGHNYLALRNERGEIVSELHGLATDEKADLWTYVGKGKGEILKVWEFDRTILDMTKLVRPGIVLLEGDESLVRSIWSKAQDCGDKINEKHIPYPPYGVSLNDTENSNSVAYTLTKCMGLESKRVGIIVPGEKTDLLEK